MRTLTRVEPAFGKHGQMTSDDAGEQARALQMPVVDGDQNGDARTADHLRNRNGISRLAPKTDPKSVKLRAQLSRLRERTRRARKSSRDSGSDRPVGERMARKKSGAGPSLVGRMAPVAALRAVDRNPSGHQTKRSGTNASNEAGPFQFDINTMLATSIDLTPLVADVPSELVLTNRVAAPASPRTIAAPAAVSVKRASDAEGAVIPSPAEKAKRRRPQGTSAKKTAAASVGVLHLVEPEPPTIETYSAWFKRVVVRNRWMMWFATFYLHWLILLLLAALIVHGPDHAAALLINATFASENDLEVHPFEILTTEPEMQEIIEPEPKPAESEAPARMEEAALDLADTILKDLVPQGSVPASDAPSQATEATEATDAAATDTSSHQQTAHVDRAPAQAVREGSFSVWTEPSNPRPGEPYRIIIQVRLPEHIKSYSINDLQGVVVGTDGYRKPIPGFMQGPLPIVDGYARLAVPIVSADKKVCDTVFIRSKLLKETQKLLIEFL